jgi:uroporphyrinogen-III decarboxylase
LRALRREAVDRVPISTYELVGWDKDAWENRQPRYHRLMELIRAKTDCLYMIGFAAPKAEAPVSVEEWHEGTSVYRRTVLHGPRGKLTTLSRSDEGLNTTWCLEHPLKSDEDVAAFLALPFVSQAPDLAPYHLAIKRLQGGRGIPLISVADPLCIVSELFEFGEFLTRVLTQPDQITALLEHVAPAVYASLETLLDLGVGPLWRICGGR